MDAVELVQAPELVFAAVHERRVGLDIRAALEDNVFYELLQK